MFRFTVPIILSLAAITNTLQHYPSPYYSAASDAQLRFALENKYDDTGPGAKEPEYAYNTYKTLEEALIGYLDDPDTKLPEQERNNAILKLVRPEYNEEFRPELQNQELKRYYPKTVEEYTGYNQQQERQNQINREALAFEEYTRLNQPKTVELYNGYRQPQNQQPLVLTKVRTNAPKKYYQTSLINLNKEYLSQLEKKKEVAQPYRLHKVKQPSRGTLLSVGHYSRDHDLQNARDNYDTHPKYSYSYGVHAPDTGDTKSAHETREGGTVRGYYSFTDPEGKKQTVHYTANDEQGFQATVETAEQ